jgi:hypothetical protein
MFESFLVGKILAQKTSKIFDRGDHHVRALPNSASLSGVAASTPFAVCKPHADI